MKEYRLAIAGRSKTHLWLEIAMGKVISWQSFGTNVGPSFFFLSLLQTPFRGRGKKKKEKVGSRKHDFKQALGPPLSGCNTPDKSSHISPLTFSHPSVRWCFNISLLLVNGIWREVVSVKDKSKQTLRFPV